MITFGVEEEYLLMEARTGLPAALATDLAARIERQPGITSEDVERELLSSQLETSTPICTTADEALAALLGFRRAAREAARPLDVVVCPTGAAPTQDAEHPHITGKERYQRIHELAGRIAEDQHVNGTHVHVAVPDREVGVQVLNRVREWVPTLVALGANSPVWEGSDSGFASWRTIHARRWALEGCPPTFRDAADYERRVSALVESGILLDAGLVTWNVRLSERYGTIEFRAADAQLNAHDAVALGVICRALVATALDDIAAEVPHVSPHAENLSGALWVAARHGLSAHLINLRRNRAEPAADAVARLITHVQSALADAGDAGLVADYLGRLWAAGNGAQRQRTAYEDGGVAALIRLYDREVGAGPESQSGAV